MSSERLNVIALISGGKDSFYSLLHCIQHGHRVVALANLFPGTDTTTGTGGIAIPDTRDSLPSQPPVTDPGPSLSLPSGIQIIDPAAWEAGATDDRGSGQSKDQSRGQVGEEPSPKDLNSFMYQTVGHEILPLYAAATGLPLYRMPISGSAVHHERDYNAAGAQGSEETESMMPLLQGIMSRHPEANALCAGAILSTYQRTRVESIALRLGLQPLAYLWQYPVLPPPCATTAVATETQLLVDMAGAGLEARIIKVASAGLDESHLWECVSSEDGARRVKSALRKFGSAEGAAALGEGGEFETIVVDGPAQLFSRRIDVPENGRRVVREGGGSSWLLLSGARVEQKPHAACEQQAVRTPDMLDPKFKAILDGFLPSASLAQDSLPASRTPHRSILSSGDSVPASAGIDLFRWSVLVDPSSSERSIQEETIQVVGKIRALASAASLDPCDITNTVIVLRRMSDFPKVNGEYGKLFAKPNPPSRVTISCGELLPPGTNIAVYITAPLPQRAVDRNGLHVQSRSYWAPANIGPYSQAIDVPVIVRQQETGLRTISIAGQIPLVPATMQLPAPSDTSYVLQVALSLQHLWRIAQELGVQYWTSSVAYFARCDSSADMQRNAKVAAAAWKQAHGSADDEDDLDGPDPWDLKYNPAYQSLAGGDAQGAKRSVPDWSTLTLRQQNEPDTCVPPMFAVEVEELPRQSTVEWHAHNGLSKVDESSLELTADPEAGTPDFKVWHSIVRTPTSKVVYSSVSCGLGESKPIFESLVNNMDETYQESIHIHLKGPNITTQTPYLIYVDATQVEAVWGLDDTVSNRLAIIPCRSIWSSSGEPLRVVALYETAFL